MGNGKSKARDRDRVISLSDEKAFIENFKKATEGKDTITREQFTKTYTVLGEFGQTFYCRLFKEEPKDLVNVKTMIKYITKGLSSYDQLAEAIIFCFGDCKEQIMRNTVKIFCEANEFSREDQVRMYEYFNAINKWPMEEFFYFFSACPLYPYIASYIFQRLLGKPGESKMPIMSTESSIFGNVDILILNSHVPFDRRKTWTLLYSNSKMGNSFSQMVKRINGEGPCIVVIHSTRGRKFGLYASRGFIAGPQYWGSDECFLFQLIPRIAVYHATGRAGDYAYLNYQQQQLPNGLGLSGSGDVWPLFIREEFTSGTCQKNSRFYEPCFVAEEEEFHIKTIEIWRPGDKPQKSFEELMDSEIRTEKSIIDKDPEARAVLEMAGKPMHSDIYRDPAPLLDKE